MSGSRAPTLAPAVASRPLAGPTQERGVPVLAADVGRFVRARSARVACGLAIGGSFILALQPSQSLGRSPLALLPAGARAVAQEGQKLTGSGEKGASEFGNSVALSANGTTAIIGGYNDDSLIGALEGLPVHSQSLGAAWVFTRTGSSWSQQGGKLLPTGERGPGNFGASVALSADGRTALIGGPAGYGGVGAAWVFARSGSTWRQLAKLTPQGMANVTGYVTNPDGFGASVALSASGTVALIGGPAADGGRGAAWVFIRSGSTWRQQGPELGGRGEIGTGQFGSSVAVSPTGDVAAIGGPFDNSGVGAVWAFRRVGSVWGQEGEKLVGRGEAGFGRFGSSVALSALGATALIGAPVDRNGAGAAWVFTRTAASWNQDGPKLTARDEIGAGQFGDHVALSSSGTTALVGAALDHAEIGAAWVFARRPSTWTQVGAKLIGRGEIGEGELGVAVALTPAATTALVGGLGDHAFAGAAWVFRLRPLLHHV